MDLYTLFNNAVTGAANYDSLLTYSQSEYGRVPEIKTDPPAEGLPGEGGCPMVIFHSPMTVADQERREINYGFGAVLFISEEDLAFRAEDNVDESDGTKILLTMSGYIKDAVRSIIPSSFTMSYSLETDTVHLFPLLSAELGFEFREEMTIGSGDPLA